MRLENDIIAGTDGEYSSGMALALSREGAGLLGNLWQLFGVQARRLISSYELGHSIWTPSDISRELPDPTDRPYAGVLSAALTTQAVDGDRLDGLRVLLGVVGPASLSAPIQEAIHRLTGSRLARGWDYQLKNELLLNVFYERRQRYTLLATDTGWGLQAIPRAGGSFGNLLVQAHAEGYVRFGRYLPDNFGTSLARGFGNVPFPTRRAASHPPNRTAVHGFAGAGAFLVAHNLTLDGNTLIDGPRVDKNGVVPWGEVGISIWTGRLEVAVSGVVAGREHEAQHRRGLFGTLGITYAF